MVRDYFRFAEESGRGDADDGGAGAVELQGLADDGGAAGEVAPPEGIAEDGYGRCAGMFPSQALQTNSTVNNGTATYSESGTGFLAGACSTRTVVPVSGASGSAWADLSHPGWIACCY